MAAVAVAVDAAVAAAGDVDVGVVADAAAAGDGVVAGDGVQLLHDYIAVANCDDVDCVTTQQAEIAADERINVAKRALRASSHKEERKDVAGIF